MKVMCHREGLLTACQLAGVALAAKDVKPILKNFKAIAGDDLCTLLATDLELGIRLQVNGVQVAEAGEAIFPANRLTAILRESTDDELLIEANADGCHVRGKVNEFEMAGEDPADFPALPTFEDDRYHEITAAPLREMIRRTVFAAAKENPRYAMTGVLWELDDKTVRLVATDGRRLAVAQGAGVAHGGHENKGQTHVVPTKAMNLLERVLQDGDEPVRVALRPNEAMFQTKQALICTRLVEGRFPNYREVFPKKQTTKVPLTIGPFYTAVRQAAIMTDDESKRVQFNFASHKLTMQARGAATGRSHVELDLPDYEGKEIAIAFDPHFLTDMLRVLAPDTTVTLELVDGTCPALFRLGSDYSYVAMPIT